MARSATSPSTRCDTSRNRPPRRGWLYPETGERLTTRELDVLRLVTAGASNRVIAERLFIGERTVKSHMTSLMRKLLASALAPRLSPAAESSVSADRGRVGVGSDPRIRLWYEAAGPAGREFDRRGISDLTDTRIRRLAVVLAVLLPVGLTIGCGNDDKGTASGICNLNLNERNGTDRETNHHQPLAMVRRARLQPG